MEKQPFSFPFHLSNTFDKSGGIPIEEQPLWLDDLLNDSETTPTSRGHRRSVSDSYGEAAMALSLDDESGFINAYFGSEQNLMLRSIIQAEGTGVSAELEFIKQQNMILIYDVSAGEQGMLEKEIGRLQSLYHLQQQQQSQLQHQQHSKNRQKSRDFDNQMKTVQTNI